MRILCIDTSTEACSAAVLSDDCVSSRVVIEPRGHADLILPMVAEVMAEAALRTTELDAIGFGCGPGSFTGIRIGASVALAIAFASELPVVPVSSLAALAQGAVRELDAANVAAAIDARMGEVYWGLYCATGNMVAPVAAERLCTPESVDELPQDGWLGVGSAWGPYEVPLSAACGRHLNGFEANRFPLAQDMVILAAREFRAGRALSAHDAHPTYLRDNVAEKSR